MARVLIIGGGLGGAATGLALARLGLKVRVFEQSSALREVGAGLTVSVGAQRGLTALGLGPQVRARSERAAKLALLHYASGKLLSGAFDDGTGGDDPDEWTTRHMHRANLHDLLVGALRELDPDAFALNHKFTTAETSGDRVRAAFANGATAEGDLLIGCDGLRSAARTHLFGPETPIFTGQVTWRCLLPIERAARFLDAGRSAIFIGPGRLFNRYTVKRKTLVNCVATAKTDVWREEGWSIPSTIAEFKAQFEDWHPDVTGLIESAPPDGLFKWALFERNPLPTWTRGRMTLLGDAAHPMLPFLGLGAALAIEDAVVLGRAIAAYGLSPDALVRYERARIGRTTELFLESRRQGQIYQGSDPDAYARANPPAQNRSFYEYDPSAAPV